MREYEGMNDWCREEGFMTGKYDGETDMQQRMLENEKRKKVSRWCRLRAASLEITSIMGRRMHDPDRKFFFRSLSF